ncbi:MAG: hypothetical protein MUE73_20330 [Planctomycetes bacterium]|jgi:hypothetical protein|nr:hypothetical protein [Planctomycetota bacterium]
MEEREGLSPAEQEAAIILYFFRGAARCRLALAAGVRIGAGSIRKERLIFRMLAHPGFRLSEELLDVLPDEELEAAARRLWIRGVSGRKALIRAILRGPARAPRGRPRRSTRWRDFYRARAFVHGLGLADAQQWLAWCKGEMKRTKGTRPPDIPETPERAYRDKGWHGIRDWLGLNADLPEEPGLLPFREARRFARRLVLRTRTEWADWTRGRIPDRPGPRPEIPARPDRAYARAWRGWADWLGLARSTGQERRWRPFPEAREFARSLNLRNSNEWLAYVRGRRPDLPPRPADIPLDPRRAYALSGFTGMSSWLGGRGTSARTWPPFEEVRAFARSLRLPSQLIWRKYVAGERPDLPPLPDNHPKAPHEVYRYRGFAGWGDFLGTGNIAPTARGRRPFAEARKFARSLGLSGIAEWKAYARGQRPDLSPPPTDIPINPRQSYRDKGWCGYPDFLGAPVRPRPFRKSMTFEEGRAMAREAGIRSEKDWRAWAAGRRPDLPPFPATAPVMAANRWKSQGWKGWLDFLGRTKTDSYRVKLRPFEEAREFARGLGLRNSKEWFRWSAGRLSDRVPRPKDVPSSPDQVFAGRGWQGWKDWLGPSYGPHSPRRTAGGRKTSMDPGESPGR